MEPLLRSPQEWEWEEVKLYDISGDILDGESATNLQEVLEMSTSIFMCLPTKLASLHHVDQRWLELEWLLNVRSRSSTDVVHSRSWELTEWLVGHGVEL
jgi:hypothetical protein